MRAIQIARLDGPSAAELAEIAEPDGSDAVVIEVHAAGVAFPDALQSRGLYQHKPELPYVPGAELAGVVRSVTVLEFMDQLKADAVLVDKLKSLPNVTIHLSAQTTEVVGDGQKMTGLKWKDRVSGEEHHQELAGVFVQIGLVPNTEWLKGTVELSKYGEIIVDAKGATSLPGIFAAGDATTVPYKQIIIAAGEGAKAALSAFDHLIRHSAAQNS